MVESPQIPTRGNLLWSGEHWLAYLQSPETKHECGMVSLYHAYASPAGSGTAAFVQIQVADGFTGLCTDNESFARFVKETQVTSSAPYDVEMPFVEGQFQKSGNVLERPTWTIRAKGRVVEISWWELQSPLVGPPTLNPRIVFTILVFAEKSSIKLDGMFVGGTPYPRDVWTKSLGMPMSSCVFALAETMIRA